MFRAKPTTKNLLLMATMYIARAHVKPTAQFSSQEDTLGS